jgi:hypothetical protein
MKFKFPKMSETVILGIQPTFYLKKIEPLVIPQKLVNGVYKNINLSLIQEWKKESIEPKNQVSVISANRQDKMFTYSDRNNNIFTFVTTNNFKMGNLVCQWCRLQFTHPWIGIPYRLEQSLDKNYYYTDGCYCCFECASAEINLMMKRSYVCHGAVLLSPNILLDNLFQSIYPNQTLKSSLPFYYHERNGGALNDKEYYQNKSEFVETSGIVIIPYKKTTIKI